MNLVHCSRRDFLKASAAGTLTGTLPALGAGAEKAKAKQFVFLFMSGGPAQLDTLDVKDTPGTSLTKPIATSVPGIQVSELLPKFAQQVQHAAIVRTMQTVIPDHALGRYYAHTGYRAAPGIAHPGIGSVVVKELEKPDAALPGFVQVGPAFGGVTGDEGISRYNFYGAGYLGPRYQPLVVKDAARGLDELRPLVTAPAFQDRLELLEELQQDFNASRQKAIVREQEVLVKRTVRLMQSKEAKAFDLAEEPARVRDAYGKTPFGDACLLARRLVEAGVCCVEVGMTGWDTHGDHLGRHQILCGALDPALAALVAELKDRGLLETTLIAWMGEMGRGLPGNGAKPGTNHHGKSGVGLLIGGGVRGGQVVGKTDAKGLEAAERPVSVPEFHAGIYHGLGIDYTKEYTALDGRPIRMVDSKDLKPLTEVFG
ncbi:MAG: DUF1501 domain-containing protein [Planctomycetia bacterium]|nr:DUF1501 domain-containing protein [Planctomycetia bacterium]